MAVFHLSIKTISRSHGRSATAAAAYRAGVRIADDRTGETFDYRRRAGVEHTEIFTPENSPEWARDREHLWNQAEQAENRKNSTVAREFEVALPAELDARQRQELTRDFANALKDRHGFVVDAAIHAPGNKGDNRNHHAHLLCSTRRIGPEGFTEKTRELDKRGSGEVDYWREQWAELANKHLERAGHEARIDHRSLEKQASERVPTIHLGPQATAMERRGHRTDRGDENRRRNQLNAQIIDLSAVREKLRQEQALPQDLPSLEAVWASEIKKRLVPIQKKADRIERHAGTMVKRQKQRLSEHEDKEPAPPKFLASIRHGKYLRRTAQWNAVRDQLWRRFWQLDKRFAWVKGYTLGISVKSPAQRHIEKILAKENKPLADALKKARDLNQQRRAMYPGNERFEIVVQLDDFRKRSWRVSVPAYLTKEEKEKQLNQNVSQFLKSLPASENKVDPKKITITAIKSRTRGRNRVAGLEL